MRSLALVVFVGAGCVETAVPTDAPGVPDRMVFLLADVDVPTVGPTGETAGFDLDATRSDGTGSGCMDAADFVSPVSGAVGVDNQLAAHVLPLVLASYPGGFAELARRDLAAGRWIVALEVTGIGSLDDDAEVFVEAWTAHASDTLALETDGRPSAGQALTAVRSLGVAPGAIASGRLRTTLPRLPLPVGEDGELLLFDVTLEADVDAAGRLSRGEGGGVANVHEIVRNAVVLGGPPPTAEMVRAVAHPDLDPTSDPTICDSISAGFVFTAVPAELTH